MRVSSLFPPPRSQAKGAQGKVCVHVPLSQHEALCSLTEVAEALLG